MSLVPDDIPRDANTNAGAGSLRPAGFGRYKLLIAYDGSGFHGWQKQEPPDAPALRTVQGEMHHALVRLFKQPINLVGASRTDSGVHARGLVAHFEAQSRVPVERMAMAINSRLPDDIEVLEAYAVDPAFDAIRDAVTKQYTYTIHNVESRPLGVRHLVHHFRHPLDAELMDEAATKLLGEHDFEGFSAAGHGRESTVRTIHRCDVQRNGGEVVITVEGNGFLWNMVRIIAGTLVEVGRGRFEAAHVDEILRTADRQLAGPTLPPNGLCLEWIKHGKSEKQPSRQAENEDSELRSSDQSLDPKP